MAFDPMGTCTKRRYINPTIISANTVKIVWQGPPNSIPSQWTAASEYEISALLALQSSSLSKIYDFYCNVPLSAIFAVNLRDFIQSYKSNPHWTGGCNRIRRMALTALRKQIGNKAVDILVCDKSGKVVGGIETDGPHHSKQDQQSWDFSKSMLFASKGLPLLRVATKSMQPSGGGSQCVNFFALLRSAKTNWSAFVQSPSIGSMQLHKP